MLGESGQLVSGLVSHMEENTTVTEYKQSGKYFYFCRGDKLIHPMDSEVLHQYCSCIATWLMSPYFVVVVIVRSRATL